MFCSFCGKQLPNNPEARFCPKCGSEITQIMVVNLAEDESADESTETSADAIAKTPADTNAEAKRTDNPKAEQNHAPASKPNGANQADKAHPAKKEKRSNKFMFGVIAVVVVAVIAACGFFMMRTANATHDVVVSIKTQGYTKAESTRIPVQITGTDIHSNAVDEMQFIDANGQGLELVEGEYQLTFLASPLTKAGTIFQMPADPMKLTIDDSKKVASAEMEMPPIDALEVKDEQIEKAKEYALQDPEADPETVEDWANAAVKAREEALEKKKKAEEEAAAKEAARKAYIEKVTEEAKYALDLEYNDYKWHTEPCSGKELAADFEKWQSDYKSFFGSDFSFYGGYHEFTYKMSSLEKLEVSDDGTVSFTLTTTIGGYSSTGDSDSYTWSWKNGPSASLAQATSTIEGSMKFDSEGKFESASFLD